MTRTEQVLDLGNELPESLHWVMNHNDNYVSGDFTKAEEFLDYAKKKKKELSPEEAKALVKRWAAANEIFGCPQTEGEKK